MNAPRIILEGSGDLIGQALAAKWALTQPRPSDSIMGLMRGGDHYAIKWNKGSIRVYRQIESQDPLSLNPSESPLSEEKA